MLDKASYHRGVDMGRGSDLYYTALAQQGLVRPGAPAAEGQLKMGGECRTHRSQQALPGR